MHSCHACRCQPMCSRTGRIFFGKQTGSLPGPGSAAPGALGGHHSDLRSGDSRRRNSRQQHRGALAGSRKGVEGRRRQRCSGRGATPHCGQCCQHGLHLRTMADIPPA
mmetsp:Transcript_63833/g.197677  ORF Transcript_63833/g.197677 Transcript_63833/m.197677 type:complete len:108 (+) Transcript_63833:598-921(+)